MHSLSCLLPRRRVLITALGVAAAITGSGLARYDADPVIQEITAQALRVSRNTQPLASARLAALLPRSCAGTGPSGLKQATGHAEAQYAGTTVVLDDFGPNAMNTVMGAAQYLGLHASDDASALLRPLPGAVGYSTYQADGRVAQARVWIGGRYVVQVIQKAARSRSDVDSCLKAISLRGFPAP